VQPLLPLESNKHYIFWVCVCIQHAMRMRNIVICDLSGSKKFSTLCYKRNDFRKKEKIIEHEMKVLIFSTTFVWKISFQAELCEIWSRMYIGLHVKYPLNLSYFNETWILSADFRKILKHQISRKSVYLKHNCSIWTDGRTDKHAEVICCFTQFCERVVL